MSLGDIGFGTLGSLSDSGDRVNPNRSSSRVPKASPSSVVQLAMVTLVHFRLHFPDRHLFLPPPSSSIAVPLPTLFRRPPTTQNTKKRSKQERGGKKAARD